MMALLGGQGSAVQNGQVEMQVGDSATFPIVLTRQAFKKLSLESWNSS